MSMYSSGLHSQDYLSDSSRTPSNKLRQDNSLGSSPYRPTEKKQQNELALAIQEQYEAQVIQLKAQLKTSSLKNDMLCQENSNLHVQISSLQRDKDDSQVSRNISDQLYDNLKTQIRNLQNDNLRLQDNLSNQKIQNLGSSRYDGSPSKIDRSEQIRKDYEERIAVILRQLEKSKEETKELQDLSSQGQKALKEIVDLKQLLNYKIQETESLKEDNEIIGQENESLKRNDELQKFQLQETQQQLENTKFQGNQRLEMQDSMHKDQVQELKNVHQKQIDVLKSEVSLMEQELDRKNGNTQKLQKQNTQNYGKITELEEQLATKNTEAQLWQQKTEMVTQEKTKELDQAQQLHKKATQDLHNMFRTEKDKLTNDLDDLKTQIAKNEEENLRYQQELKKNQLELSNQELEKYQKEQEIKQLAMQLENKQKELDLKLGLMEQEKQQKMNSIQQFHELEKEKLEKEVQNLNSMISFKHEEHEKAKIQLEGMNNKLQKHETKVRDTSQEADFWKKQANQLDRKLSQNKIQSTNQVQLLKDIHQNEIQQKDQEKEQLSNILQDKHIRFETQKLTQNQLQDQMEKLEKEKIQQLAESQLWRQKASELEKVKNDELLKKDIEKRQQIQQLNKSHTLERESMNRQLQQLSNQLVKQTLDNSDYTNSIYSANPAQSYNKLQ